MSQFCKQIRAVLRNSLSGFLLNQINDTIDTRNLEVDNKIVVLILIALDSLENQ